MTININTFVLEYESGNKLIGNLNSALEEGDEFDGVVVKGVSVGDSVSELNKYQCSCEPENVILVQDGVDASALLNAAPDMLKH